SSRRTSIISSLFHTVGPMPSPRPPSTNGMSTIIVSTFSILMGPPGLPGPSGAPSRAGRVGRPAAVASFVSPPLGDVASRVGAAYEPVAGPRRQVVRRGVAVGQVLNGPVLRHVAELVRALVGEERVGAGGDAVDDVARDSRVRQADGHQLRQVAGARPEAQHAPVGHSRV